MQLNVKHFIRPLSVVHSISLIHSLMKEDNTIISLNSFLFSFCWLHKVNNILQMALEEDTLVVNPINLSSKHRLVSALRSRNILTLMESKFITLKTTPTICGILERQSLEDNCLSADGEEMSNTCKSFVRFSIMLP